MNEIKGACKFCELPNSALHYGMASDADYICVYCWLASLPVCDRAVKYTWELDDSEVEEVLAGSLVLRLAAETGGMNL